MFDLKTRVLIIDDMITMRKVVRRICKEIGFTDVTEAIDGLEAWAILTQSVPAIGLIISDWNMPNCSGLELLIRIRSDERFKSLPFVLLTAEGEKHQIVSALKAGVTGYIVKPFNSASLKTQLDAIEKNIEPGKWRL